MSYYGYYDDNKIIPLAFSGANAVKVSDYFRAILIKLSHNKEKFRDIDIRIVDHEKAPDCDLKYDALWLSRKIIQSVQSIDQLAHIIAIKRHDHGDYKKSAIDMARGGFNPANNLLENLPKFISDNNKSRFEVALTAAIRELAEKYNISVQNMSQSPIDPDILKIINDAKQQTEIDFVDQKFNELKFESLDLDGKIRAMGTVARAINESKIYDWRDGFRPKFEERFIIVLREILERAPHVIIKKSEYKPEQYKSNQNATEQVNAYGWHRGRAENVMPSAGHYPFMIVPDDEYDAAMAENAKRKFDGKYEYALLNELIAENERNKFSYLCQLCTYHLPRIDFRDAGKVGQDFIEMAERIFSGGKKPEDNLKLDNLLGYFSGNMIENGDRIAGQIFDNTCYPDHVPVARFTGIPTADISIGARIPFVEPGSGQRLFGIYSSEGWGKDQWVHLSNGDFTLNHFDHVTNKTTWFLIDKDKYIKKHFAEKEYEKFRKDCVNAASKELSKLVAKQVAQEIRETRALIASKNRLKKMPIAELIKLKTMIGQTNYHPRLLKSEHYSYQHRRDCVSRWQNVRNAFAVDHFGMFYNNGKSDPKLDIKKVFKKIKEQWEKDDALLKSVEYNYSEIMKYLSRLNRDWLNNIDEDEDRIVLRALERRAGEIPESFLEEFFSYDNKALYRTFNDDDYMHGDKAMQQSVRGISGFTMHQLAELLHYMHDNKRKGKEKSREVSKYLEVQNLNIYCQAGHHFDMFEPVNDYFHDDMISTLTTLVTSKDEDKKFPLTDMSKLPGKSEDERWGPVENLARDMIKEPLRRAMKNPENWPVDAKSATDIINQANTFVYAGDHPRDIFVKIAASDENPDNIRYAASTLPKGFFYRDHSELAESFCNLPALWDGDISARFNMYELLTEKKLFPADHELQYKKFQELLPDILALPYEQRFEILVQMSGSDLRINDPILRNAVFGHLTDAMLELLGGGKDDASDAYLEKAKALKGRMYGYGDNKTDYYDIMKMLAEKTQSQKKLSALLKPENSIQEDLFSSHFVYGEIYQEVQRIFRDDGGGHELIDFLMGPGDISDCQKILSELRKKRDWIQLSENELYLFHQEFTLSHLEARAFVINEIMNNITTRDESEKENWVQVFEHVISRMFPMATRNVEDDTIIEFINEYIKSSPKESRRIKLTAMLCGFRQDSGNARASKWAGVRKFMENAGPAAIKLGQSMSAFPQVPADLRGELRLLKTDADRPARWELYEWLEKAENKNAFSDTDRVGNIIGSASYFVAVEKNGGSVVKILRPGAAIKANDEFKVFENTLHELNTTGTHAGQLDIFQSVVSNARKSSEIETNLTVGAKQNETATNLYPKHITVGKNKYDLNVMGWNSFGAGFATMPRAPGVNFDQIENMEFKREVAQAYLTMEISHILRGGIFDSDRHMGQMKIDATGHSIGLFDFGSMMMAAPSADDLDKLGSTLKKSFVDGKLSLGKFSDEIITYGNPDYLLSVLRAIIALSDYSDLLSDKDIVNCVLDAAKNGVNSKLAKSLGAARFALQFPRISKNIISFCRG